jgi:hypothetical protein
LEDEAYPALDELTSEISTLNLERVRLIKNRLVALSGRVQKVNNSRAQTPCYQFRLFFYIGNMLLVSARGYNL